MIYYAICSRLSFGHVVGLRKQWECKSKWVIQTITRLSYFLESSRLQRKYFPEGEKQDLGKRKLNENVLDTWKCDMSIAPSQD